MEEKDEEEKQPMTSGIAAMVHARFEEAMKIVEEKMKEMEEKMAGMKIPPLTHFVPASRSNVVASRIGDEELRVIDMLIEAGLFSTRSEAVAYLVSEGIKARKDALDKVSSALEEIRKIRKETEEHIQKLKKEIGLIESEALEEPMQQKKCPQCTKDLTKLPEDIAVCPYCGFNLRKG